MLYWRKSHDIKLKGFAMSETHRITVDPNQCGGRPCLRGLRIRVKDVLDLLAAGADREEILSDYPLLEADDITAALEYAARQSDHPVMRVGYCPPVVIARSPCDEAIQGLRDAAPKPAGALRRPLDCFALLAMTDR